MTVPVAENESSNGNGDKLCASPVDQMKIYCSYTSNSTKEHIQS